MAKEAKGCRRTWCMAFAFDPPAALHQVLAAWAYDDPQIHGRLVAAIVGGEVLRSDRPGLGVELDRDFLKRYATGVAA